MREKRPRFVSSRALQALVKVRKRGRKGANEQPNEVKSGKRGKNLDDLSSHPLFSLLVTPHHHHQLFRHQQAGPGPDPTADEDCYICLRPVGTKNLPSTSKVGLAGGVGAAKRDCAATDDDGDEIDETTDPEDDAGEKGRFPAPRVQRRHEDGGDGDCDEQRLKQQEIQQLQPQQQQQQQQRLRRQSSPGSGGGGGSPLSARQSPPRAILRLPCGHRYCDCCLRRWLSSHSSCPTCRWAFPERDCETVPKEF